MIEKLGFVLLGALTTGICYLIKRKIESKPELEILDKQQKVLDIHKKMSEQGLDISGFNQFALNARGLAVKPALKRGVKQSTGKMKINLVARRWSV